MESEKTAYPFTQSISYFEGSYLFREPEDEVRTQQRLVLQLWPLEGKTPEGVGTLSGQADRSLALWCLLDTHTARLHLMMHTRVPDGEIPEDEPWRTDKPQPAVQYFKELMESLISP
ncbi:hypothetical protein LZ32DRAFT_660892 [Colletotrichum eremochloae]|nr:hypothetical protein LZ32DRAFT_660892 [Colletotrichum eremochloae]